MIDLAQADRTLRQQTRNTNPFARYRTWTKAMAQAAKDLGYEHWLDAPTEHEDPTFIRLARQYHKTIE
jgi:hypothetical protein